MDDAATTLKMPPGADVAAYKRALLERYENPALRHRTWQICMDGSQKLPQRLLGTIRDRLAAGAPIDRLVMGVAGWMRYVTGIDEQGKPIDVRDPLSARLRAIADEAGLVAERLAPALLEVREIFTAELAADPRFRTAVTDALARIIAKGAKAAVAEMSRLTIAPPVASPTLRVQSPHGVSMRISFLRLGCSQIAARLDRSLRCSSARPSVRPRRTQRPSVSARQGITGIEGPAVDADGNLYFVSRNGLKDGKIRQLKPGAKKSELYAPLTDGRLGNGIRFDKDGRMYVADFKGHNVLVFEKGQKKDNVYFTTNTLPPSATKFTQPNDLAIGNDGTIYASDPAFGSGTGRIWRITRAPSGKGSGEVMTSNRKDGKMGVTNGLDVSPDGKTLYVGESTTGQIWAYRIDGNKLTAGEPLAPLATLSGGQLDGLRTDTSGQIYVTHNGGKKITVLTPQGVNGARNSDPWERAVQPDLRRPRRQDRLRHADGRRLR